MGFVACSTQMCRRGRKRKLVCLSIRSTATHVADPDAMLQGVDMLVNESAGHWRALLYVHDDDGVCDGRGRKTEDAGGGARQAEIRSMVFESKDRRWTARDSGSPDIFQMPIRHGMTIGESSRSSSMARMGIGADLVVVPLKNWRREAVVRSDRIALDQPFPNMRNLLQATLYPGVGAIEGTNLSVGRGTGTLFEQLGAPWIDGVQLSGALNARRLFRRQLLSRAVSGLEQIRKRRNARVSSWSCRPMASRSGRSGSAWRLRRRCTSRYGSTFELEAAERLFGSKDALTRIRAGDDPEAIAASWAVGELPIASSLSASSPLPTFLQHYRRTLLRDDLGSTVTGRDAELAVDQLIALGGEFAIPMMSEGDLIGLLIVGPKRSGDAYFSDDLELLSTLSHQAVIAMRNAQLYRQVVLVNEYVENILATMESGVVATDSLRTITLCNKAAERMTGTTAETLRSQGIGKLPDALREPLEATLGDGQPQTQLESALVDDAGRVIPVVCATSPLKDRAGAVLGELSSSAI